MNLTAALAHLFPGLTFGPSGECRVEVNGGAEFIAEWRRPEPQPTAAEIEAARKPAALALVTERIKAERDRRELEDGIPVTFPGLDGVWRFHSDTLGGRHLLGLFNVALKMRVAQLPGSTPMPGEPGTLGFKTMGREERVQLTVDRVELLEQATFAKAGALHAAAVAHIAAAALLDDPLAYDYSTGWPE
jgi:hypothetical protein